MRLSYLPFEHPYQVLILRQRFLHRELATDQPADQSLIRVGDRWPVIHRRVRNCCKLLRQCAFAQPFDPFCFTNSMRRMR